MYTIYICITLCNYIELYIIYVYKIIYIYIIMIIAV